MKIVALAGGVGGAKLADGLAQILPPADLTIIVNTGDDFEHLGLHISPDLDTVCYTLAGLANLATGWGRADESWHAFEGMTKLGGPDWFRLGDRDLATHLERTRRLRAGDSLSAITRDFCRAWGVKPTVLPMSDDPAPTIVLTSEGELPFQEYFVHRGCQPQVTGFRLEGHPRPAPGALEALRATDAVVICPSNPWVSVDPVLGVRGLRELTQTCRVVAVSPIVGGQAIKGPAAKMYAELGITPSALAVAKHYGALLDGFVLDTVDAALAALLKIPVLATQSIMDTPASRARLAQEIVNFIEGEILL